MVWRGKEIVNISREFLNTNGAHQEASVEALLPSDGADSFFRNLELSAVEKDLDCGDVKKAWLDTLSDLNVCSQKGLVEMFDSSIGAGSVWMPYGGRYQLTETQAMVGKLPVLEGRTDTVTLMAYGFDPYLSSWSPYHGAVYAVLESLSRIVAAGGDCGKVRFTFQEYFGRMNERPSRWSQPFTALLGAYAAQIGFGLPSIGGKDSMSGTFNEIDVPPTLVSFAVDTGKQQDIITPEFKQAGNRIVLFTIEKDEYDLPVYEKVLELYQEVQRQIQSGALISAYALDGKGIAPAVSKMAFGNKLGVELYTDAVSKLSDMFKISGPSTKALFAPGFGCLVAEAAAGQEEKVVQAINAAGLTGHCAVIGEVTQKQAFVYGDVSIPLEEALGAWTRTLDKVFPAAAADLGAKEINTGVYKADTVYVCRKKAAKPTVFIPVFPGTNCEYDSAAAFRRAGADVSVKVFQNLNAKDIRDSVEEFVKSIEQAQILMFPGGFSAGDEPEGSAKFFANAFRNEKIKDAVMRLLNERDGLALGICNGFQALVKLGLVPYGEIIEQKPDSPTLTYNTIGRHISRMVYTKVVSNKSPWLAKAELGKTYVIPASHGEGRFVADQKWLDKLFANGQVATQYVDDTGAPTMDGEWNVNGSYMSIEGITSPDGRVFGKMAHSERRGESVAINIYGEQDMKIFESGVAYFQ